MIVLYGDGLNTGGSGGISGLIEVDVDRVEIEEQMSDSTTNTFIAPDADIADSSFTDTSATHVSISVMNLTFTVPGADDFKISKVNATVESKALAYAGGTGPLDKTTLISEVFGSMENTVSKAGDDITAVFQGQDVTANIVTGTQDGFELGTEVTPLGNDEYKVAITNDGGILDIAEISCILSLILTVTVTKGSVSEDKDIPIAYKNILYRPKTLRATTEDLFVADGKFKMSGGWLNDNIVDMVRYPVFKIDADPLTSFFRNKFYEYYDPIHFSGDMARFAFTSARIGDGFSGYHTVAKKSPAPLNLNGTAKYYSDTSEGTVAFDIVEGVMTVDTADADSDEGYAIFEFQFPDSLYVSELFHMPCKTADTKPLAIAIDCKVAYDPFIGLMPVSVQTNPALLSTKSFFTFIMSYIHVLGLSVLTHILLFMPFVLMTRGMSSLLTPGMIESAFQMVFLNLHTQGTNAIGGPVGKQFGWLYRSIGHQIANSSRGLSKVQQEALMDELIVAFEDELARSRSKPGMLVFAFLNIPLIFPFHYSDGLFIKPTALGACWESDLNEMYSDTNAVVNDDFKALARRHGLLSHSDTNINMRGTGGTTLYGFPAFSGSLTRIIMNGNVNDIGGIPDPLFNTAKNWSGVNASSDVNSLEGWLARIMKNSVGGRFDRFSFTAPSDDIGVPASELNDRPVSIGGGNNAALTYGARGTKIAHINLDDSTVKIWTSGKQGVVEPCKIIKPNPNIILAV